jgi:hypothetical protein
MSFRRTINGVALIGVLLLSACKKEVQNTSDTTQEVVPTGLLKLHLHTFIGEQEVDAYSIETPMADGRLISLNLAQMYLSDIQLVKLDGSLYNVPSNGVLKVFESESVTIGNVAVGNYKSVRFKVGLLPSVNKLAPTVTGYANLLNQPEMWFSSKAEPDGYVFLNFTGNIDTTASKTGALVPFEYKIGTDAHLVQVEMPQQNFSLLKDVVGYVHMKIDYAKLFDGIDLSNNENLHVKTTTENSKPVVKSIIKNIPNMFLYEN